jgi:hypothetical protein
MKLNRNVLIAAIVPALLMSAQISRADDAGVWNGTWNGTLGKTKPWPITVTVDQGKVVNFTENGATFDVKYTNITPTILSFGDPLHYSMKLIKTGDTTANVKIQGRHGVGTGALTKS